MRKWLTEEYITWPKTIPVEARSREICKIHIQNVPVTYEDGNQFAVRVYDPEIKDSSPRPALIMYHGGGWVHGFPEVDEGLTHQIPLDLGRIPNIYHRNC